jgi:hypothetical protein
MKKYQFFEFKEDSIMLAARNIVPIVFAVLVLFGACLAAEDCIQFNPNNTTARQINGNWKVVQGDMWMLDFGANQEEAQRAAKIINHYGMTSQCFVGRPNASMEYYLVNGKSPEGAFQGEDAIPFDPNRIEVKQINGRWKIVEGDHWILDFENSESEAREGFAIIKKYGFDHICFVGRPDPGMTYFRKDAPKVQKEPKGSLIDAIGGLLKPKSPKITAKMEVKPIEYKGPSPGKVEFKGTITAGGPCVVKYTFDRNDGATYPEQTLTFTEAGSKNVYTSWTLSKEYVGWELIRITSPVQLNSNKAPFAITLTE